MAMTKKFVLACVGLGLLAMVAMPTSRPVELIGMPPPTLPASMADRKSMFSYLKSQSWTPADEQGYLAQRLGLPADQAPAAAAKAPTGTQNLHTAAPAQTAVAAAAEAAGARRDTPEHSLRMSSNNVPYFQTQLHPQPRYRPNGMHAAAASYAGELKRQGIVTTGGHFLDGNQDRQLARELSNEELSYSGLEESDPTARPVGPHLSQADASTLAQSLRAGERYAFLPNHGQQRAAPVGVPVAEARQLAQQLGEGERYANVGAWAVPVATDGGAVSEVEAKKLAQQLEEGERFAQLPDHGKVVPHVGANKLTKAQMMQQMALAKSLESGEMAADLGTAGSGEESEVQRGERHAWGVHRPGQYAQLTAPQAANLHAYLQKGLRQVFGSRHVPEPTYVTREGAMQLEKGYRDGEAAEAKLGAVPRRRYEGVKEAMKMSNEMQQALSKYDAGQGHYVHSYLRQVEGAKYPATQQVLRQKQPAMTQDAKNRALGEQLEAGIDYVKSATAAKKPADGKPKMMSMSEIKELGSYLQAPFKKVKGQASALRYAV